MFLIVKNVSVPNMTYLASFSLNISNEKTKTGLLVKELDPQFNGPVLKGSKVKSAFHPSEIDQMGTRNFLKLSDKK